MNLVPPPPSAATTEKERNASRKWERSSGGFRAVFESGLELTSSDETGAVEVLMLLVSEGAP